MAASDQYPVRQEPCSTMKAKGVPVYRMPRLAKLMHRPDSVPKRALSKCRAMNTVQAKNAGAQPSPIKPCPMSRVVYECAVAQMTAPTTAQGAAHNTVRRGPYTSMATPMGSCVRPKVR